MAAARSASGVIVPQPLPWHRRLGAAMVAGALRLCINTWRIRWQEHPGEKLNPVGPVIYCVWHNRLPAAIATYDEFAQSHWPSQGLAAMISASRLCQMAKITFGGAPLWK